MTASIDRLAAALSDRYTLERELGAGGMATVYLAHDIKHDRNVAIKVLRPELAAVIGAERFLREIKTIATLQHPHILGLIDSGEVHGTAYYVMPFVEGESLHDLLAREKQLPITETIRIATEVASALGYAHRHGVIHRDIKPDNILLHDGSAMVADFGIALALSSGAGTRMTETGMSLGTPQYMSPEQAMGAREITARSDVYALGAVTYEMLTGEPPFTGATAQAIVARVLTESPRALSAQRRTVPMNVEAAVLTALQKLPADRFGSAKAFADALADPMFVGQGMQRGGSRTDRSRLVSNRPLLAALALSAVLLAAAVAGWLRPSPQATANVQRVVMWQHAMESPFDPGAVRIGNQAAIAPDGSSIVYTDSSNGTFHLMRKRRREAVGTLMEGTEGAVSPFFSPDGRWIGYRAIDGKLRKVPVDGGGSITLADDGDITYTSSTWQDDGSILYLGSTRGLLRLGTTGARGEPLGRDTVAVSRDILQIAALPGSRGFLFTECPGNCAILSSLYVYDVAADTARLLVTGAAGGWYAPTGHLLYTDRAGGLYAMAFDLKTMKITSGPVPVIADVVPTSVALSPSGTMLYTVTKGGIAPSQLMWVARDGRAVPFDSTWRADFSYPALSPDGTMLAVSVNDGTTQLWVRRTDGTSQKLTQDGVVNWRPAWTPDGMSIVFSGARKGGKTRNDFDLYSVPVDRSSTPTTLVQHVWGLWEGEYSRDGKWLLIRADEDSGASNIRGRLLQGDTALVPLVVSPKFQATQIALSPDGKWLAYTGTQSGAREIYVAPFPDAKSSRPVSRDGGIEPRWAHSGRELFYKSGTRFMVVDVTPGPTLTLGTPRELFSVTGYRSARNRQQYDVAPDDKHFVMIRELADTEGELIYAENWFSELLTKLNR